MAEKTFRTGILITGDASGAQKAIKLTEDQLASLNRKVAESGSSFGAWSKHLGAAAATAAKWTAVAAGAAVAGGAALIKSSIDAADATAILAGKLGITTEALSKLEYAAKLSDVSQASLESGLKKLSRTLADGLDPATKSAKALADIGLSAAALLKLPADQQLGAIADALSRVENQSERAAMAQRLLGRAGVDLLPLLAEGSQGINSLGNELERLGGVIDSDFASRAAAFNDNMDRLKTAAQGVGFSITEALMPSLESMSDRLVKLAANDGAMSGLNVLFEGFQWVLTTAANAAVMAAEGVGLLTAEIVDLLTVTNTEKLAKLNEELDALKKRRDLLGGLPGGGERRVAELAEVAARIEALEKERKALMAVVEAQDRQAEGAEDLHEIDMRTIPARRRLSDDLAKAAAANAKKLEEARQREIEKTQDLIQSLMQEQAALRMAERDQARFAAQLKLGAGATEAQRLEVDRLVRANFDLQESQRAAEEAAAEQARAMKEAAEQTDPWAEALTGAVERVDSAFVDMWKNIGDGFDGFADSLKESFKQLLAELAHLAITRPIVMKIGAALGLGGGSASAFAGGGGGGGLNLGSIFSLGSSLKGAWSGFQSGGLSGALGGLFGGSSGSGFGSMLAGSGASLYGGMFDLASSLGLESLSGAAFDTMSKYLGNTFGQNLMLTGGNILGGIAGGWAGNKLGQSLFGERETTGIGSTLGGVIGSAFGPLGSLAGSFLGSLAENAIGKIFGLGDHQKWVKSGVQTGNQPITDGSDQRTETALSGLQLTSVAKRSDPAGANALLDAMLGLDEALTIAARANGITIDFTGKTLGRTSLDVDGNGPPVSYKTAAESADEFVRDWLAQITDELPQRVRSVLGDISRKSAEEIVKTFGFATDLDRLLEIDVLKAVADTVAESQKTILDAYDAATEAVMGLAQEYDGSVESMAALTASLTDQKAVAAQLAAAYQEVSGLVEATFGSAITSIEESLLSESDLYARRRSQIAGLTDELAGTVDPARIAELVTQIDSLANSAWSLLDEGQRQALGQEFIDFLTQAQELANEQIAEGKASLGDREGAVKGAIDLEILNTAALTQQAAADTFQGSVNQFGEIINGFTTDFDAIRAYLASQGYEVNA